MSESAIPKIVCVRISGTEKAVRTFLAKYPMQAESTKRDGDRVILEVFIPEHVVEEVKGATELKVEVMFDASARGRERQKEVGQGNRFEGDQRIPKGLGTKTRGGPQ